MAKVIRKILLIFCTITFFIGFSITAHAEDGGIEFITCNQNDAAVSNVTYEVMDLNGQVIMTCTSDENGRSFISLPAGTYYYRDTITNQEKKFKLDCGQQLTKKMAVYVNLIPEAVSGENHTLTTESDLRVLSNISAERFDVMLAGTNMAGLGYVLVQIEQEYGINALYILGLTGIESGFGASNMAKNKNNLVGWGAYDSDPSKAVEFENKAQCLLYIGQKMKENYLTEDGKYFHGYTPSAIDVCYCTDPSHAQKIVNIVNGRLALLDN